MLTFIDESGMPLFGIELSRLIIFVIIGLAIAIGLYLLRSFGLYKLASKKGIDKAYIAFIPFVWIYVVCKLIGEVKVFNKDYSHFSTLISVVFAFSQIAILVSNFLWYFPVVGYVFAEGSNAAITIPSITDVTNLGGQWYWTGEFLVGNNVTSLIYPYSNPTLVYKILTWLDLFNGLLEIVILFMTISIYIALFRKYWPQHFLLASVLSIFGLFAPLVFIIRNNNAVKWSEYTRSKYNYYTPYPTDRSQYEQKQNNTESPFSEFSDKSTKNEDPFSEFSDKNK